VLLRRRILTAIDAAGLIATPTLEGLSLDATVTFERAAGATPTHDPIEDRTSPTSPVIPPRALEPEIAQALRRSRAALRVADIPGALEPAPTIAPATTWMQARTRLQLGESHALIVVTGTRMVRGAVTWRSLANSAGDPDAVVTPEPIGSIAHDARLLDVLPVLAAEGHAVVLDAQRLPFGPVDARAALRVLHAESEPYLLIEEIEFHLRALLDTKLTNYEFAGARGAPDQGRRVTGAADLTFGEYERLLQRPDLWPRLGLEKRLDREAFVERLGEVRILRNRVMHFDRAHRSVNDLQLLRKMVEFLRRHIAVEE
jgi:hypothetical protein